MAQRSTALGCKPSELVSTVVQIHLPPFINMTIKTITVDNAFSDEPFDITLGDTVLCIVKDTLPYALQVISIIDSPEGFLLYGRTQFGGYAAISWKEATKNFPKVVESPNDTQ